MKTDRMVWHGMHQYSIVYYWLHEKKDRTRTSRLHVDYTSMVSGVDVPSIVGATSAPLNGAVKRSFCVAVWYTQRVLS